jgi:putative membrane protein
VTLVALPTVSLAPDDLAQLVPLALLCVLYARRVRTLAPREPVPRRRQACFYAGCLIIAATLGLLGRVSGELLFAHMAESLLLGNIAALLIVLGLTGPLADFRSAGVFYPLRAVANPLIAFPLWAADLGVWYLPGPHQAALEHAPVQVLQHALLVLCGVNLWMCLLGPLPTPAWFGNLARLPYIVAVWLVSAALGNVLLWSDVVFYPYYLPTDAQHRLSPIADQNLAGAMMVVEGTLFTIGLFCWLFLRVAHEARERQALLELSRLHGIPLSEKRIARALSAGQSKELRSRLEGRAEATI